MANYLIYFLELAFVLLIIFSEKSRRTELLKIAIIAFLIGEIFAKVGGMMFYNPRPFVAEHIKPLLAHSPNNGFPSSHTLFSMMIALTALIFNKRLGAALVVSAFMVGAARVLAKVHHPIDIIGGALIAAFAVYLAWLITKRTRIVKV